MENISIQPCTLVGLAKIIPILEAQSASFDYTDKRRIIRQASKELENNPRNPLLYLAVHDSITVGFIGFSISPENPSDSELFAHVVKKGYQGRGIGTNLFNTGVKKLEDIGTGQVLLQLRATTPPYVSKFYRKIGFKPVFDETYTGATDELLKYTYIFRVPYEATPPGFYPA